MVAKFVVILALVGCAMASDFSAFQYSVADPYTGDFKAQTESRADGRVAGQYSLLEADGTRRVVDYAAGAEGFNAQVRKDLPLAPLAPAPALSYAPALPYAYNYARFGAFPYYAAPYAAPYAYPRFY